MDYYVQTTSGTIRIPKENLDKCYQALCALNANHNDKHGGSGTSVEEILKEDRDMKKDIQAIKTLVIPNKETLGIPNRSFSWMPWNYDQIFESAKEIIEHLGFTTMTDSNGDLLVTEYNNKARQKRHFFKAGQEELFFSAIAPYVDPDSELGWHSEDGNYWNWVFENGKLVIEDGFFYFCSKLV